MKALTDNIVSSLEDKLKGFVGRLDNEITIAEATGFKNGLSWAIDTIKTLESQAEFEEITMVLIKHLNQRVDLYHPHHKVIVTSTTSELLEGCKSVGIILDYVQD